jgi:tripartite-type tricarboxylate transporter receptor subunit TctC
VLLVLLLGYVVADFVHNPFIAPTGSAAVPVPRVTLWVAGSVAGGDAALVARDTAAALQLRGTTTAVETLSGGSSQAVADFFTARGPGIPLLVVTNVTLADLAGDRADGLVPGAGMQAAVAQQLLRAAVPIGLLSTDALELGVPQRSPIRQPAQLLAAMRAAPAARLFGLPDDTWSRDELAALVQAAGVPGRTRFAAYPSGAEAVQALARGEVDTVLATRGALRAEGVRRLAWPFGGANAPRAWVALVAPPWLPRAEIATLRHAIGGPQPARLDGLIVRGIRSADALEALARVVEAR